MSSQTPNYNFIVCTGNDLVNPLTQIFPNFTALDTILRNIANTGITTATEVKTGTVHALTRSDTAVPMIRFQAVSRFDVGDTFTVDGVSVTATLPDGETLPDGGYIIGSMVLCELRDTQLTVYTSDSIANVNAAFNIGNTDISEIGDGSIKGAISTLNSSLSGTNITLQKVDSVVSSVSYKAYKISKLLTIVANVTLNTALTAGQSYTLLFGLTDTISTEPFVRVSNTSNGKDVGMCRIDPSVGSIVMFAESSVASGSTLSITLNAIIG